MVDRRIWRALEQLAGQPHITRGEEGWNVVLWTSGSSLSSRSFQNLLATQPVKLGGLGLRSLHNAFSPLKGFGKLRNDYLGPHFLLLRLFQIENYNNIAL